MNSNISAEGIKTRFKRQSGYPRGRPRPRKKPISGRLADILESPLSPEELNSMPPATRKHFPKGVTHADALVIAVVLKAIDEGDLARFREILEAVEGRNR